MNRILASCIVLSFVLVGTFGMTAFLNDPMHSGHCPFTLDESAICTTSILQHLGHWQAAFADIVASGLLIAIFVLVQILPDIFKLPDRRRAALFQIHRRPEPVLLFQQLFSQGILNRKVP